MTATSEAEEPLRVDARGLQCPWPVLRAARAMREADTVFLLADDPVARTDVPALAHAHGWHVEMDEIGPESFVFRLVRAPQTGAR